MYSFTLGYIALYSTSCDHGYVMNTIFLEVWYSLLNLLARVFSCYVQGKKKDGQERTSFHLRVSEPHRTNYFSLL